jgi:lipoprotein-anchoring transpeptidase ErfK/SrfK
MATPRALRLVAASFLGGGLLAFVALAPWSRGALSTGASPGTASLASSRLAADPLTYDSHAVAESMALDTAAQADTRAYIRDQTAIYLTEMARQEAERARADEEARRQAAAEAEARDLAAAQPPEGVSFAPDERWIAINLTTQRATAFVGAEPVHVARVTTGVPGWETPAGDFRIYMRVENETMDSLTIGIPRDDPWGYYLENVYFTQYFVGGVALHYNYWRPDSYFGNVPSSHGCVGMRYDDAKFFWDFATIGTRVVVHN